MPGKRWPHNKHGSRVSPSQLERSSTVNSLVDRDCIMLDGDCKCFEISDCKYIKPEGETIMPCDISLVRHRDRFYVVANTPNGTTWKEKIMKSVLGDGDSVDIEFLKEYETLLITAGLDVEIK